MKQKAEIINCTPHEITIVKNGEIIQTFPRGEIIPRLAQKTIEYGSLNNVPLTKTEFGETENLPDEKEGIFFIVSRLVMSANPDRSDLLVPNGIVRDEGGVIIGSESLAIN